MPNKTRRELIILTWRGLGEPRVGAKELGSIHRALGEVFGPGAEQSPSAIARVLADEGAELHHPEVIECDARWREAQINRRTKRFRNLEKLLQKEWLSLGQAETLIEKFEELRQRFETESDRDALALLNSLAVSARAVAELIASDLHTDRQRRAEQTEIVEWLKIWIQTPNLFASWIELRKRSAEFKRKFGGETT
jgi:hypothetical protein